MENIKAIVSRILNRADTGGLPPEEKDYLSFWEDAVPQEIRRHARVLVKKNELTVFADNPTTRHQLFLLERELLRSFQENRLPVKKITVKIGTVREGYAAGVNRSAGNAV